MGGRTLALLAHQVEREFSKLQAIGSSPIQRSSKEMKVRKTYELVGGGLVRFSPEHLQAVVPIFDPIYKGPDLEWAESLREVAVFLLNGSHYSLPSKYYDELLALMGSGEDT